MDLSTLVGLLLGIGGILVGNAIEGGHFSSLIQITAGVIVFGGTFGAAFVSNSPETVRLGFYLLRWVFRRDDEDIFMKTSAQIVELAQIARKESILALENHISSIKFPFMKEIFRLIIDGVEADRLKEVYEARIQIEEERLLKGAKFWSDAGGFAPTIGIIGAVLGLISVMSNLTNTAELGKGIAVAFVATVYGVGSANLLFLPIANKIKAKVQRESDLKSLVLDGGLYIVEGQSPRLVDERMRAYTVSPERPLGSVQ